MRTLTCPRCRKPWEVDSLRAGMKAVCPNCHASITISSGPTAAKPVPVSASPAAATVASATAASAVTKSATASAPEIVTPKASDSATPAAIHPAAARASVAPAPRVVPIASLPTTANGSVAAVSAKPLAEDLAAQTKSEATEASNNDKGRKSRLPMIVAFVLLLLVAGGVAGIWRPWDQPSKQSVVTLPSNKAVPAPQASTIPPNLPESTPPVVELPPIAKPSSTEKTPQPSLSVVEPEPIAKSSSLPAPSVKPSVSAPPTPVLVQNPAITVLPPSNPPIIRKPVVPPPKYDRSALAPGTEGTQLVSPQTSLRAGDHLHGQYEGRWYAVTVVETLDDGSVRVRWDTWGKDIVGSIPRLRLRLPAKN